MVQAGQRYVVALAGQRALLVHQPLRHDEQRDAAHARHQPAVRAGNLRQHQMDDVLGQLVIAVADPHLVAAQAVAGAERIAVGALAVRLGAGGDVGEAGAGLRLAQAHRAEEAAGEFLVREDALLRRRAVRHQQVRVAGGQHVPAQADARLGEEAVGGHLDDAGQLHAAQRGVLRRGQHAGLDIGAAGRVRRGGQDDLLAVEARLLQVGGAVGRRELLAGDALAGVEHRGEGLAAVVGEAGARGQRFDAQPVVEQEVEGGAHGANLRAPRTRPQRPCRRRCTSSRRHTWRRGAGLRSARGRPGAGRSCRRGGRARWRRR